MITLILCLFLGDPCIQVIGKSSGTGVLISPNGMILTANHLVSGETSVFYDKERFRAKLLGRDSEQDIAILKIEGKFDCVKLGTKYSGFGYAVGNPFNSSLKRENIQFLGEEKIFLDQKYFQTLKIRGGIVGGFSGGPIFDLKSNRVVAIIIAKDNKTDGYCIPVKNLVRMLNQNGIYPIKF